MDPTFKIQKDIQQLVFKLTEILIVKKIPLFFETPCRNLIYILKENIQIYSNVISSNYYQSNFLHWAHSAFDRSRGEASLGSLEGNGEKLAGPLLWSPVSLPFEVLTARIVSTDPLTILSCCNIFGSFQFSQIWNLVLKATLYKTIFIT